MKLSVLTNGLSLEQKLRALHIEPLIVAYLILIAPVSVALAGTRVEATRVDPAPNYDLTRDRDDVAQLTDGRAVSYPSWKNRAGVGWARATPITLWLTLRGADPTKSNFSGRLRLHTVTRSQSGIQMPKRVDVYASSGERAWMHVRGVQLSSAALEDDEDRWLEVEVADVPAKLFVVVHANGEFFFADEILWEDLPLKPVTETRSHINGYRKAVADSISRLREAFTTSTQATPQQVSEWTSTFGGSSTVAWVEHPWDALTGTPKVSRIELGMGKSVQLMGARDEMESGCIGILNRSADEANITVGLRGNAMVRDALRVHTIKPVTAADGKTAYDALMPYTLGEPIRLSARSASYLWVTADLNRLPVGAHTATLEVRGSGVKQDVPLDIRVKDITIDKEIVHAVNWGYPEDKPIWQDPKAATADLVKHGINVFVIPPVRIPPPRVAGRQKLQDFRTLIDTVRLNEGRGTYLLFLDWPPGRLADRHLEWLHPDTGLPISQRRDILARWLELLDSAMQTAGVSRDRWALYPVDEYSGKHVDYLCDLFSLLKSIEPAPRIYANPIDTPSNPTQTSDLKALATYVDQWQPELSFAESSGRDFFQSTQSDWWVYIVPPSPAKSTPPMFYRAIAWRAWRLGAIGVGFWSYSDTRGTSAWDDFDGRQPDWAVLYEGNQPTSSRRWEAFREGVEDLRLLRHASVKGLPGTVGARADLQQEINSTTIEAWRMALLNPPEFTQ